MTSSTEITMLHIETQNPGATVYLGSYQSTQQTYQADEMEAGITSATDSDAKPWRQAQGMLQSMRMLNCPSCTGTGT